MILERVWIEYHDVGEGAGTEATAIRQRQIVGG